MKMFQVLATASLVLAAGSVSAAITPIASKYCSFTGGTDTSTSTNQSGFSTSDVTYSPNYTAGSNIVANPATDCYGQIEKNDPGVGQGGNMGADDISALWGSGFVELVKVNTTTLVTTTSGTSALGFFWSLSALANSTAGEWVLTATDANTQDSITLPDYFDFVVNLKGSDASAAYLFDEALFDGAGGGKWAMKITTGNNGSLAGLSNFTVFGRDGSTTYCPPGTPGCGGGPSQTPEPATLALVGMALLGAAATRRRRRG